MTEKWKKRGMEEMKNERMAAVRFSSLPVFQLPHLIILGLILLATWFRLWQLNSIPPGLWFDEGLNAMEAVWMLKTKTWPVFILQGQGREAMFYYLLAPSISLLGKNIYAVRLVPALLGVVSISLMYRWILTLYKGKPAACWIALIGAAGLTVSFWYLVMNRVGYRANTLLPVLLFTSYFFWRGWQTGKIRYYFVAGIGLGLCQYTYLAGRLVPLVFILFVLVQTGLGWKHNWPGLKRTWLGILGMAGVAVLVTVPMLLFFVNSPELLWERSDDVALELDPESNSTMTLGAQVVSAIRVFVDGQDPNWRHHLLGQPVLNWFSIIGFWIGLLAVIKHSRRRPANIFLLSMLLVMWLPALLSEPAFHTLRLVGILPAFYVIVAMGWLNMVSWAIHRFSMRLTVRQTGLIALVALLLLSGGVTFYNYFYRWAKLPEVYRAFDGSVVALARELAALESDVILPFYLYAHASMRYLLNDQFQEAVFVPDSVLAELKQRQSISMVIPEYPEDDEKPPAFVWLTRNDSGSGIAYVSAVARELSPSISKSDLVMPIEDSQGNVIAHQYHVNAQKIVPFFLQRIPQKKSAVVWADNLALTGYEFVPATIKPSEMSYLYLAWKILGYTGLQETMFLQLLDSRGTPVGQKEIQPISRKMYRWRDDGLILERHPLQLDVIESGLYFVRLGFFDPETGQRLPTYTLDNKLLGDELVLGPLYVGDKDVVSPQYPVRARLGSEFEFWGYSIYPLEAENAIEVELYWKTHTSVDINYTAFVQLLDQNNQIIAQVDAQPLANMYPTSRWQSGDIISDRFVLPVAASELSGENRLVTGMYDLTTGVRLPVYNEQGDLLPDGLVQLTE